MNGIPPPGSEAYYNELEWEQRRLLANKHKFRRISELLPGLENLFRQKHKAELNKGVMTEDDIKKLAIKHAIKMVKSNGGKTKRRRSKKHRRTLKRK